MVVDIEYMGVLGLDFWVSLGLPGGVWLVGFIQVNSGGILRAEQVLRWAVGDVVRLLFLQAS